MILQDSVRNETLANGWVASFLLRLIGVYSDGESATSGLEDVSVLS